MNDTYDKEDYEKKYYKKYEYDLILRILIDLFMQRM